MFTSTAYQDPTRRLVPNAQNALVNTIITKSGGFVVVPAFLEEWASMPEFVKGLSGLLYVSYPGSPLSKKAGDALVDAGMKLECVYGTTEVTAFTTCGRIPGDQKEWEWVRRGLNKRIRREPVGDETLECQMLSSDAHQASVENLPDVKGYATSDVFTKHPTIEGLYKVVGKLGDVLVLSSREETMPAPMETVFGTSRQVSDVCTFGRGRSQVGVLVEPRLEYAINVEDEKQVAEFGNLIRHVAHLRNHAVLSVNLCRPVVEEANDDAPNRSRIFREKILVTSRDKPVLRTGKGTVTKKATLSLYESEIDLLYGTVEASATAGIEAPLPSERATPNVEDWLVAHATAVNSDEFVDPDVDLFEQGFDSLSATFLGNRINGSLKASPDQNVREAVSRISRNIVFAYPTLRLLAGQLVNIVARKAGIVDAKAEIEHMLERYSSGLPGKRIDGIPTRRDRNEPHVVLVTGSTGALGSYIVSSLLQREEVAQIYVLNRRSKTTTSQERQLSTFQDRGLNTVLLESQKLVYVDGDTSREDLGLEGETYAGIRDSVTVIIHNAWPIDFKMSLAMLEPNVRGTRNLIDLALASKKTTKPRFMFTSSITSAQNWDKKRGRVPEDVIADVTVAVGSGYGASKYVSERMLGMSGLPATSFRIGQITGATPRGAWPVTELVPMAVKSSVTLGALPDLGRVLQSVAWLPVDAVSGAILDVALSDDEPPIMVNLVHPRPVEFEALMKPISDALFGNNITKERLPLPAIKLLDYLRMFDRRSSGEDNNVMAIMFSTDTAERVSKTMQVLPPISRLDAMRWVEYWVSVGWFQNVVGMSRDAMQPSVLKMGGNVVKDVKAKL
ncbi:putative nonribosomal peptide synthetase [Pisolithus thermaeus]|nr:putative nonribosomal peptide synthetase [Pisolithus thermaeus]